METFFASLNIMWKGMLGIFAVIVVILLAVVLMNALFRKKPEDKK